MDRQNTPRLHGTRLRRVGRRPSRLSRFIAWLVRAVPSPLQQRAKVRGRLEHLQALQALERTGGDGP